MINIKKSRGNKGENEALEYLKKDGYKILEKNYTALKMGEIDIIAEKDGYIIFVEVKTRSENSIASPQEFVTPSKQQKIIKSATFYLMNNKTDLQPRFDIIEVFIEFTKIERINHIENAFTLERIKR
ncbi:MAG: YraN family protein [Clostridia bacterium]